MYIASVVLVFALGYSSMEAEAVDRCEKSITDSYVFVNQNLPSLTERMCGRQYWKAAGDNFGTDALTPLGIEFGENTNSACTMTAYKSDSDGNKTADWSSVVTDVVDYKYIKYLFSSSLANLFVLPCSQNLIAVKRCMMSWEASGANYQVYAPYGTSQAEISEELEFCIAKITLFDEEAVLYKLPPPDFY